MIYYKKTTGVQVSVIPLFLQEGTRHERQVHMWAYCVQIRNDRHDTIQLYCRFWDITSADGYTQKVAGEGVVGNQPFLKPGGSYEYASGAVLSTPSGIMVGQYEMRRACGALFMVEIPPFYLDSPYQTSVVH